MPLPPVVNQGAFAELERIAPGQVRADGHHRRLYSTDASNYQVEPLAVVVPRDAETVARLVGFCGGRGLPVLMRGGGTSLAGQCTNRAVVIDHSAHCRRILELDAAARTCRVEPGVYLDDLNRWLAERKSGLFYAPDPATSAQATIGGCLGNNAAGARSIKYGRTSENVAALRVVLSDGRRMTLGPGAGRRDPQVAELARRVADVVLRHGELIRQRYPRTTRRNAGYALDGVLQQLDRGIGPEDLDLTGLICGSEGTLAVVLEATLKLHPAVRHRGLAIASFGSVGEAIAAVPAALGTGPSAIEMLDEVVMAAARGNAQCRGYLDLLPPREGDGAMAVLYVEYQAADSPRQVEEGFARLRAAWPGVAVRTYQDAASLLRAWALRKSGEPLLHNLSAHRKPLSVIEDNAVPVENLARFVEGCRQIITRHGTMAAYYGHASVGVLHIRPMLDLRDPADRQRMLAIAIEVADLARDCGGVMSGEHGDGRVRGPLLERFYGPELVAAFAQVKAIFDPPGILNPGMIVNTGPVEAILQNLRISTDGHGPRAAAETYFDYSDQEGFAGALEMCNGAGVCRKMAGGTMCPSYRATLEERHSTRGRGNALREIILGGGPPDWADAETRMTLSLCLSCKACKSECPSNVDVARLKAEYTAQGYRQQGRAPLRARVFGHVRGLNRLGSMFPRLANAMVRLRPMRAVLYNLLGLAPQRALPSFAPSLHRWYDSRPQTRRPGRPRVVLFADCFTTYNEPHIGRCAVEVLERLGYEVLLPRAGCCGRAMISTGLLDDARHTIDRTIARLRPHIEDDAIQAILVAEPSCLAAMKDEWLGLRLSAPIDLRRRCAAKAMMVEEFIDRRWAEHPAAPAPTPPPPEHPLVLLHGHCHQKALFGEQTTANLLRRLLGDRLRVLPSGCCGMAGSFGYTADHYELSMRIYTQSLGDLLAAHPPDALLVAPGTSCRHQLRDAPVPRSSLHPIQLVHRLLAGGIESLSH